MTSQALREQPGRCQPAVGRGNGVVRMVGRYATTIGDPLRVCQRRWNVYQ